MVDIFMTEARIRADHLTRTAKFFGLLGLVPLCVGFTVAWSAGFGFLFLIIGVPAALLVAVVDATSIAFRGARLPSSTTSEWALSVGFPALLLVGALVAAIPLLRGGSYAGTFLRLIVNRAHYEAIIRKAQVIKSPAWFAEDRGVTFSTDSGPPLRVAFNQEGFLDNWSGIIYDPTGKVMQARGFDKRGKFYAPDEVTKLFAGDLVNCRHLLGSYYYCNFT